MEYVINISYVLGIMYRIGSTRKLIRGARNACCEFYVLIMKHLLCRINIHHLCMYREPSIQTGTKSVSPSSPSLSSLQQSHHPLRASKHQTSTSQYPKLPAPDPDDHPIAPSRASSRPLTYSVWELQEEPETRFDLPFEARDPLMREVQGARMMMWSSQRAW